jgi:deoxyhypusine synthase
MQSDYSVVMPFLMKALFENRARYQERAEHEGEEQLFAHQPKARGYLRPREGYRLFEQRARLNAVLTEEVRNNREWLLESLSYPLAMKA